MHALDSERLFQIKQIPVVGHQVGGAGAEGGSQHGIVFGVSFYCASQRRGFHLQRDVGQPFEPVGPVWVAPFSEGGGRGDGLSPFLTQGSGGAGSKCPLGKQTENPARLASPAQGRDDRAGIKNGSRLHAV